MLKNLQLLRAFAALCVVVHHYNFLNFHTGAFGVDIFFVISGFIISFTIEKNSSQFFLKRLARVAPMYYLTTSLVIILWFLKPALFKTTFVDVTAIVKSFLFISYPQGPVLGLGYTLNYEMYFYVIVGCFLKFCKTPAQALIYTGILLIFVCSLQHVFFQGSYVFHFYSHNIILEFVYGIIVYFVYNHFKTKPFSKIQLYYLLFLSIGALAFLVYIGYPEIQLSLRGFLFGIPAFVICTFVVFSDRHFKSNSFFYKYFFTLGNASYVMYLIHPFVIFGVLRLIDPLLGSPNMILATIEFLITIGIVCEISIFIHRKIELPLQAFFKNQFLIKYPVVKS